MISLKQNVLFLLILTSAQILFATNKAPHRTIKTPALETQYRSIQTPNFASFTPEELILLNKNTYKYWLVDAVIARIHSLSNNKISRETSLQLIKKLHTHPELTQAITLYQRKTLDIFENKTNRQPWAAVNNLRFLENIFQRNIQFIQEQLALLANNTF